MDGDHVNLKANEQDSKAHQHIVEVAECIPSARWEVGGRQEA